MNEPLFWTSVAQGKGKRTKPAALMVSTATVNAITRGHPWILTDSETSDAGRYQPGTLVPFKAKGAQREGWARVEGTGKLAARVWSLGEADAEHSVESRVERALIERQELLAQANDTRGTNCFRLIHGEADLLPGLAVDYLAGALRILVRGRASDGFRHEVVASLQRRLSAYRCAEAPVVEVLYLVDSPKGDLERVRLLKGKEEVLPHFENGRFVVCERGLRFWVKLGLGRPTSAAPGVGLYLDQRSNRARIDTLIRTELAECAGGVWLNLFAHTGAFSVAALAAGAAHVTSVDLSKPYLRTADENLALNGLAPDKHESVKADARQFVEKLAGRRFDGVILDPPTAARCGRRFWSFQKDGVKLIADVLEHLNPGGALLISRNTHGHRGELKKMLNRAADRAGVALADIRPAPPSPDFPAVTGFPEGDAFQAHLVRRH